MILAAALACHGDGRRPDTGPSGGLDTGDTGPEPTEVPACTFSPCVVDLAVGQVEGPPGSWFGQELVASADSDGVWLAVGAPVSTASYADAEVWLLAMTDLTTVRKWRSTEAFDDAGSALSFLPGAEGSSSVVVGAFGAGDAVQVASGAVFVVPPGEAGKPALQASADLALRGSNETFGRPRLGFDVSAATVGLEGIEILVSAPSGPYYGTLTEGSAIYAFDPTLVGEGTDNAARRAIRSSAWGMSRVTASDHSGDGMADVVVGVEGTTAAEIHFIEAPWAADLVLADAVSFGALSEGSGGLAALDDLGDVTGDGYPDFAVGDTTWSGAVDRAGGLFVVEGGISGQVAVEQTPLRWEGTFDGEAVGAAARGADFNGDGATDLVASAYGIQPSEQPGKVAIFLGPLAEISFTSDLADAVVYGELAGDNFGIDLAAADGDGDGRADLAVGASGYANDAGAVYLISGSALVP